MTTYTTTSTGSTFTFTLPKAEGMVDRFRFLAKSGQKTKTPILAEAPDPKVADGIAVLRLYDPIDSWGEFWGVSAKEFIDALDSLPKDTSEIHVHINSPGGEVFEGIAILNALRAHEAKIVTVVDGLAASAASFIAMAGDEVVMLRNSELMIHDAWGACVGNAADMQKMADELGHFSDNLADVYAAKAGGTVAEWRAVMAAETWFSADEAVAAGLADRIDNLGTDEDSSKAKARFDLSVFAHAGRANAPAPKTPVASAPGSAAAGGTSTEEEVGMSDSLLEGLREQLGLSADADEATVLAKNKEALDALEALNDTKDSDIPPAALAEITRLSTDLAALTAANAKRDKDELFASWLREGKTSPAEREQLEVMYDAAPEQTKALVNARAVGSVVPVGEIGTDNSPSELSDDEIYNALYGEKKGA